MERQAGVRWARGAGVGRDSGGAAGGGHGVPVAAVQQLGLIVRGRVSPGEGLAHAYRYIRIYGEVNGKCCHKG